MQDTQNEITSTIISIIQDKIKSLNELEVTNIDGIVSLINSLSYYDKIEVFRLLFNSKAITDKQINNIINNENTNKAIVLKALFNSEKITNEQINNIINNQNTKKVIVLKALNKSNKAEEYINDQKNFDNWFEIITQFKEDNDKYIGLKLLCKTTNKENFDKIVSLINSLKNSSLNDEVNKIEVFISLFNSKVITNEQINNIINDENTDKAIALKVLLNSNKAKQYLDDETKFNNIIKIINSFSGYIKEEMFELLFNSKAITDDIKQKITLLKNMKEVSGLLGNQITNEGNIKID